MTGRPSPWLAGGALALRAGAKRRTQGVMNNGPPENDPAVSPREARELTTLMATIARAAIDQTVRALSSLSEPLTIAQFRAMFILYKSDSESLTALAQELDVKPSSALRMIERLEARNLAVRGASPTDRRATVILLTRKGRNIVDDIMEKRAQQTARTIERIPDDKHIMVMDALEILAKASHVPKIDAPPPIADEL